MTISTDMEYPPKAVANDNAQLGMGLQLMRASTLTMTRLHLALQSGDRRLALSAMDGLLEIDAEMEGFVEGLVGEDAGADPHWTALAGYLVHQKSAIAVEKHMLIAMKDREASPETEIMVPAIVEDFPVIQTQPDITVEAYVEEEGQDDRPRRVSPGLIVLLLLCIIAIAAAGAAFAAGWLS